MDIDKYLFQSNKVRNLQPGLEPLYDLTRVVHFPVFRDPDLVFDKHAFVRRQKSREDTQASDATLRLDTDRPPAGAFREQIIPHPVPHGVDEDVSPLGRNVPNKPALLGAPKKTEPDDAGEFRFLEEEETVGRIPAMVCNGGVTHRDKVLLHFHANAEDIFVTEQTAEYMASYLEVRSL